MSAGCIVSLTTSLVSAALLRTRRLGCPRPSAAGAVGLLGGGDPILLVNRPAAVRFPHLGLGHVNPADPVGLPDIHLWYTFWAMALFYLVTARTEIHPIVPVLTSRELVPHRGVSRIPFNVYTSTNCVPIGECPPPSSLAFTICLQRNREPRCNL
jgi:hypothetical protein